MAVSIKTGSGGSSEEVFRAEIRPNAAMSSRSLAVIVICLSVVCLAIALGFASLGLWLVLPFAGLELIIVGIAVGYVIRGSADCEIITVQGDEVVVTRYRGEGPSRECRRHVFQRYWAKVWLEPGTDRLQHSQLMIGSHGKRVQIGAHTTEEAKFELAAGLKKVLGAGT